MEAPPDWIGYFARALTIVSLVGSLSISWRVWRTSSSPGVACSHIWLLYGSATGNSRATVLSVGGLILTTVYETPHRVLTHERGALLHLVALFVLICIVWSMISVEQLGGLLFAWSLTYNLSWIPAIPFFGRTIGRWRITIFGLWTLYAWLAGNERLCTTNFIGFFAGILEVCCRPELQ
ncbi:hypothetical protein HPB52_024205 [Rhipicephalus sanguineus]|uniref:Uncharacterized protein n=1 Tax=Rhipicephalus sanguineus TaxID=34632 RepID=A0A9D4YR96_RHISA|nr:hypothetical protein HPB52_024205 [Rhipicephalus sanguineus]